MVKPTSGSREASRMALGAAVLAALFFPSFAIWCFIQGLHWGVPFSFSNFVQFLGFSLLMAVLILALVALVMAIRKAGSTGHVVALLAAFLAIFLLVLLGFFWLFMIRWSGPWVWDILFSPAVRSVWIYALPVVAGAVYAAVVVVVCLPREKKGKAA